MYRGRYQLGEEIPLALITTDASGTPQAPDAPPVVELWGPSGKALSRSMPVRDRYSATGLFHLRQYLDARFAAGPWRAVYRYTVGSYKGSALDTFEIAAGGHADGQAVAMHFFSRPQADFLVRHLDSGKVMKGRNPGV